MTRSRTLLAILALMLLAIPAVAAGCGGDDDPRDVLQRMLDSDTEVTSGNFNLSLEGSATGQEEGSFEAQVGGPFQGDADDPDALPQFDLTASASGEGAGESIDFEAEVAITEDNAFLRFENETYEIGKQSFAEFREQVGQIAGAQEDDEDGDRMSAREACEQAIEQAGGDPDACDINVIDDWFTNLENEGTEDVEGTETTQISGDLDVERVLADLGDAVATIPGADLQGFEPAQLAAAVPEASFSVFSGTEDDHLRRLDVSLAIDPAAVTGGVGLVPVERVDISFSFVLGDLNVPQTITPPTGPKRPIEELLGEDPFDLGRGLGGLTPGGLAPGAAGGGDAGGGDAGGDGAGDAGAGGGQDAEELEEYFDCIAEAEGDPDAIQACGSDL